MSDIPFIEHHDQLLKSIQDKAAAKATPDRPGHGQRRRGMTPTQEGQPTLAPCPFCGGKAEAWTYTDRGFERGSVRCLDCNVRFYHGTEAQAIAAWNRRFTATAGPAEAVKALVWDDHNGKRYFAKSVVGEYAIIRHGNHFALVTPEAGFDGFGYPFEGPVENCKSAAQQHYEARIRSALAAPAASPVASEEMVHAGKEWFEANFNGMPSADSLVRGILTAALSPAPAGEAGWRTTALDTVRDIKRVARELEQGNSKRNAAAILYGIAESLNAALPASPTGGDK